jgi:hypothetical protein
MFVFCFGIVSWSPAQLPVINSVTPNSTSIGSYSKLELAVNLTANYTNPYDYDEIAVQCIFTSPSSKKDTIDGFYVQDYTLNTTDGKIAATGDGGFKIRFTPVEAGEWKYQVICTNALGSVRSNVGSFACKASDAPGFIRKNGSDYLSFDNGNQYIPIGEDMGWQKTNAYIDYSNWLGKLSANGGNFVRVWMATWSFGLEWQNGRNGYAGLKKYKQSNAYYLDWLLDKCEQSGVYMMLCLNNHGQVSSNINPEWKGNPYNSSLGGPCANTWDFFTDSTAKADIKNRLRYVIARYGYSTAIMSWELFNEVEWTDNFRKYKSSVTSWHNEMAAFIKARDVYGHLVTTSYANDYNDANTWNLADIDFTQTHNYLNSPNLEGILAADNQTYLSAYHKPTLNAEFGLTTEGLNLSQADPNGVHFHNALWGAMFSGAMGSAMSWWWDNYIEPQNLYYHYKTLSAFVATVKLKGDNYTKAPTTTSGGGEADLSILPAAAWGAAGERELVITADSGITRALTNLAHALTSNKGSTLPHKPTSLHINYPVSGGFGVNVEKMNGAPRLAVYVDSIPVLDTSVAANKTYAVNVAAGAHTIAVDNTGTGWMNISSYTFANAGQPLSTYVLRSTANDKAAGWILNNKYNWQYLKNNNNVAPPPVTGATLTILGMSKGVYKITFFNCATGRYTDAGNVKVKDGNLVVVLPPVAWDIAFTATKK